MQPIELLEINSIIHASAPAVQHRVRLHKGLAPVTSHAQGRPRAGALGSSRPGLCHAQQLICGGLIGLPGEEGHE